MVRRAFVRVRRSDPELLAKQAAQFLEMHVLSRACEH